MGKSREGKDMDDEAVKRACNLWRGFLISKDVSPELALIYCKGALLTLRTDDIAATA